MGAETRSCKDTIGLHCDCAWGQVYFHPFFFHFNSISICANSKEIKQWSITLKNGVHFKGTTHNGQGIIWN